MTIDVTLVIPILNEAETLPVLFQRIYGQSRRPTAIIFCDAGSDDGSLMIINKAIEEFNWGNTTISVIVSPGSMPGRGRNIGIKTSNTDWVCFLDGGIDPEPNWLEQLFVTAIETGSAAVFGQCYFSAIDPFPRAVCALSYGQGSSHPVIPSMLVKRSVFTKTGYFPEQLRAAEDIVWIERFLHHFGPRTISPQAKSHYSHFPKTWLQAIAKWRVFEKNSVIAGVRRKQHLIYLVSIPILYLSLISAQPWGIGLFLLYAGLRGIIDPIRRSREWSWWKGAGGAFWIAIPLALALDIAKLVGIFDAYWLSLSSIEDKSKV